MSPDRTWDELSLVFTDDDGIRKVNYAHLGRDDVTDVISFRYDPLPGNENGHAGEIVVNVTRALQEGARRGGAARELALYLAHGCDHLAGENDDTPEGYSRMRRRELRWLQKADESRLVDGLVEMENGTDK